jgi:hypothetical protein
MYTGLAIAAAIAGVIFWLLLSKYKEVEEELNESEQYVAQAVPATAIGIKGQHEEV